MQEKWGYWIARVQTDAKNLDQRRRLNATLVFVRCLLRIDINLLVYITDLLLATRHSATGYGFWIRSILFFLSFFNLYFFACIFFFFIGQLPIHLSTRLIRATCSILFVSFFFSHSTSGFSSAAMLLCCVLFVGQFDLRIRKLGYDLRTL